jgi:hypothetical protein
MVGGGNSADWQAAMDKGLFNQFKGQDGKGPQARWQMLESCNCPQDWPCV